MMRIATLLLVLSAFLLAGAALAEPEKILDEAAGILPLEGERRLIVEGVFATVHVRAGRAGELRWLSTPEGSPKEELPLELWSDGATLIFRADEDEAAPLSDLQVALPESMSLSVDVAADVILVQGLREEVDILAEGATVQAREIYGPTRLELTGGEIDGRALAGGLTLDATDLKGEIKGIKGGADVNLVGADVELNDLEGPLEATLERSRFRVGSSAGPLRLEADNSQVELDGIGEADLRLSETPLVLSASTAPVTIQSDAIVNVQGNEELVTISGYGASVEASDSRGPLTIRSDGASINLRAATAAVDIAGSGLEVQLADMAGEVKLALTSSQVKVNGSGGEIVVENEFGVVETENTRGRIDITNRDGDVFVRTASGPVGIDVDGGAVEVGWVTMPGKEDSLIKNASGDVTITLPGKGGCRLEATAEGRIESDHPDVQVSDDGQRAVGSINRFSRPTLRIESAGALYVRAN